MHRSDQSKQLRTNIQDMKAEPSTTRVGKHTSPCGAGFGAGATVCRAVEPKGGFVMCIFQGFSYRERTTITIHLTLVIKTLEPDLYYLFT